MSFFPHAASRGQAFAHCQRFLIAAVRRRGARVSVLLWLVTLVRSAIRRRLGRPLPYQLPDGPQAPPMASSYALYPLNSFRSERDYAGLSHLSMSYPPPWGRFLRVTQPSAAIVQSTHRSKFRVTRYTFFKYMIRGTFIPETSCALHNRSTCIS